MLFNELTSNCNLLPTRRRLASKICSLVDSSLQSCCPLGSITSYVTLHLWIWISLKNAKHWFLLPRSICIRTGPTHRSDAQQLAARPGFNVNGAARIFTLANLTYCSSLVYSVPVWGIIFFIYFYFKKDSFKLPESWRLTKLIHRKAPWPESILKDLWSLLANFENYERKIFNF